MSSDNNEPVPVIKVCRIRLTWRYCPCPHYSGAIQCGVDYGWLGSQRNSLAKCVVVGTYENMTVYNKTERTGCRAICFHDKLNDGLFVRICFIVVQRSAAAHLLFMWLYVAFNMDRLLQTVANCCRSQLNIYI